MISVSIFIIFFLIVCSLVLLMLRDVLASIIAFAVYSFGMAIFWVVLQAPDVGLTEAAVGSGVMTILFLVTIAKTVRPRKEKLVESLSLRNVFIVSVFTVLLLMTVFYLPEVGDPGSPVNSYRVTQYYLDNSFQETGVKNFVTAVLAAYRGYDTLGEVTAVFTAGIAALVIFRRCRPR